MADTTLVQTKYASSNVSFTNDSGLSNYTFLPIEATFGRSDNAQARANSRVVNQSLLVNSGFGFDIPDNATIQTVKVRFFAQSNPLSTQVQLRDGTGTIIESLPSASPNVQYTMSATYTPEQINNIQFGWYTQSDAMSYYAYLDAMEIEVTYVDHREMVQSAVDLYAKSTLGTPHTNIASYAGGPLYLSEAKFLGPTDGVVAQIPTANTSAWTLGVQLDDLVLPENARVDEVWFRAVTGTSIAATLFLSPNTNFSTDYFQAGTVNNTSPWFKLGITPTRDEIVGDNYMQVRFSNTSNRKAIDSLIMTVIYSVPAPEGPEVKHWNGTEWQSITDPQLWDGNTWMPLEYTIY